MKVLVFGHRARRGGVPTHLGHLARALPAEGFDPIFAVPDDAPYRDLLPDVVTFEQRGKADLVAPVRAARLVRSTGARLVATHARPTDLWAGLGARLAGVPAVATLHAEPGRSPAGETRTDPRARAHGRALRHLAGRVIVVARPFVALARERLDVPVAKLRVVENGVDLRAMGDRARARRLLGIPEDELALGCIARFVAHGSEEKGQPDLVRALGATSGVLHLVGSGESEEAVRGLVRTLGLDARVRFHGERASSDVIHAFDALVLASRSEGCPYAVLEAMAAGVPVVATAVGGVPDVLGDAGVVVPPRDPAALARAIDRLADPGTRRLLGSGGRARAEERYGLARFGRETAAVYGEALSGAT